MKLAISGFESRQIPFGDIAQLAEHSPLKRLVVGSSPTIPLCLLTKLCEALAKAVAALVCESSISQFKSGQTPQMESTAEWPATGLENQGRAKL